MIFRQSTVDDAAIENWDIEDNVLSRGEIGYEGISRVILPPNTDYTIFALYADSLMFGSTLWTELSPTGTKPTNNRYYTRAVWDASDSALYVYHSLSNVTWKLESDAWIQLASSPTKPGLGFHAV